MNAIKSFFLNGRKSAQLNKTCFLVTGGELRITHDLITNCSQVISKRKELDINYTAPSMLVQYNSQYSGDSAYAEYQSYENIEGVKLLITNQAEVNQNSTIIDYLKKEQLAIKNILHLNHKEILTDYDSTTASEDNINYDELKDVIKELIDKPIILTSSLIKENLFAADSNVYFLALQKPFAIPPKFKPNHMLKNTFDNMKKLYCLPIKSKNIHFCVLNLGTIDSSYIQFLDYYIESISDSKPDLCDKLRNVVNSYNKNYRPSIDMMTFLLTEENNNRDKDSYIDVKNYI